MTTVTVITNSGNIDLHRYYAVKKDNPSELVKGFDSITECRNYCFNFNLLVYDSLLNEIRDVLY